MSCTLCGAPLAPEAHRCRRCGLDQRSHLDRWGWLLVIGTLVAVYVVTLLIALVDR